MPKVRSGGDARWVARAAAATEDYKSGISNPRRPWQEATVAAESAQAAGVQAAIAAKRFVKGVNKAGNVKWSGKAISKGAARFGPGVADAQSDYAAAVAPYLQTIAATTLPPRGAKGDPRNIERVRAIADALHKKKIAV